MSSRQEVQFERLERGPGDPRGWDAHASKISIASRGVGGMNGRPSARARTAGGKMVGKRLERRARACRFLSDFSRSHLDISGPADDGSVPPDP